MQTWLVSVAREGPETRSQNDERRDGHRRTDNGVGQLCPESWMGILRRGFFTLPTPRVLLGFQVMAPGQ